VVLSLTRAFPQAALYTSVYEPGETFPAFRQVDVRTTWINHAAVLRRRHRLALPLLAPAFGRLRVDAEVVICSSSGWAHGIRTTGRKIVYCHTPARWLYQPDRYLRARSPARLPLALMRGFLERWDRRAAASADLYVANSTFVQRLIRDVYGIEARVLAPPHGVDPAGDHSSLIEAEPGFFLCVSRLLPYKNVDALATAFARLPHERLIVIGTGPDEARLRRIAPPNVVFAGVANDEQLRWAYANCRALVAPSYEDFGLTPLEAAAFGRPSVALRWGGYLDTVVEDVTGVFFDEPTPEAIGRAVEAALQNDWHPELLVERAEQFSEARFIDRIRALAAEVMNGRTQ
jgi:glycosyltransferase involved in cell wall biosynthesis